MTLNFKFRFFVRPTKAQGDSTPTPLRILVWISSVQKNFYISTGIMATAKQLGKFSDDGIAKGGADPQLTRVIEIYRTATTLVVSQAIANNLVETLTSEYLSHLVNGVAKSINANKGNKPHRFHVFTTPMMTPICTGCKYRDEKCKASWPTRLDAETASDFATFNGACSMKQETREFSKISPFDWTITRFLTAKSDNPDIDSAYLFIKIFGDAMKEVADLIFDYNDPLEKNLKVAQHLDPIMRGGLRIFEEKQRRKEGNNGANE